MSAKNNKRDQYGVRIQEYDRYDIDVDFEAIEADDLAPILEAGINVLKKTGGAIAKFENSPEGLQKFIDRTTSYFSYVKEANERTEGNRLIPDVEGWTSYIGTTRQTILTYQRERGNDWKEAIEQVKNIIMACKKQLAQTGKIPPMIAVLDWVNNSDYRNTNEFKLSTEITDKTSKKTLEEIMQERGIQQIQEIAENKEMPKAEF